MARDVIAPWAEAAPQTSTPMTAEELAILPEDGWLYELVDGRLVRMAPPGGEHGDLTLDLGAALRIFTKAAGLGRTLGADTGFQINQAGQPDTVLAPDVAFIRAERVPAPGTQAYRGYWRIAPDLVVEIASPSQYRPEMADKARLWLAAGSRLVWVVWPERRQVDVWHPGDARPIVLTIADTLDGEEVVPGFSYVIRSLFE